MTFQNSSSVELGQIGNDGNRRIFDPFVMQRAGEMMMIDDVMALFRPEDHRDHVPAEKLFAFFNRCFAPAFTLRHDLAHADGDLGRTQIGNVDRRQNGLANHFPLLKQMA